VQSAKRLAGYLARELSLDSRQADRLRFGAEVIFSTVLGTAAIAAMGYLLGCPAEALAAAAACAAVRGYAGGAHCSTAWCCALTSGTAFAALGQAAAMLTPHLNGTEPLVIFLGGALSASLVFRLAPVDSPVKPIAEPDRRARLRKRALLAVFLVTALLLVLVHLFATPGLFLAAGFGLAWSGLLLTGPLHRLMALADGALGFCARLLRRVSMSPAGP